MRKPGYRFFLSVFSLCLCVTVVPIAGAHPYPDSGYHRNINVMLLPDKVLVTYRLEVDAAVVFLDVPALAEPAELPRITKKKDFYDLFTRCYAPILADNLVGKVDGKPLTFRAVKQEYKEREDGHLLCEFTLESPWQPASNGRHAFTVREGNFESKTGRIDLSLNGGNGLSLLETIEPDANLKKRPFTELKPGEEGQLRHASATFTRTADATAVPEPAATPTLELPTSDKSHGLLDLLDSPHGFWMLLLLAALFGAAHAWTPGHGKTVAAAYLVGENGTIANALLLGLVTTLTHTGAVILLALILPWLLPHLSLEQVQAVLGVGGGLLIAGLGFWLLMRRLTGQADHFHVGGHHHHQHDAEQPNSLPAGPGYWGVIVLGISGGIVPCTDAIILFLFATFSGKVALVLPLLLAFSAGLATVLVLIGVGIVYAKGFAAGRWGESPVFKALPLISAILITGMGLWLCYSSLHPPA